MVGIAVMGGVRGAGAVASAEPATDREVTLGREWWVLRVPGANGASPLVCGASLRAGDPEPLQAAEVTVDTRPCFVVFAVESALDAEALASTRRAAQALFGDACTIAVVRACAARRVVAELLVADSRSRDLAAPSCDAACALSVTLASWGWGRLGAITVSFVGAGGDVTRVESHHDGVRWRARTTTVPSAALCPDGAPTGQPRSRARLRAQRRAS